MSKKRIRYVCRNCGMQESREVSTGAPAPGKCPENADGAGHSWADIRRMTQEERALARTRREASGWSQNKGVEKAAEEQLARTRRGINGLGGVFSAGKDIQEELRLEINQAIKEACSQMDHEELEEARNILSAAAKKFEDAKLYRGDAFYPFGPAEYYAFNSTLEFSIYIHLYQVTKSKKNVVHIAEPIDALYHRLGYVLVELGDLDAAKAALEKAMRWNPIAPDISFEYANIFNRRGDMEEFLRLTMQIFPRAYRAEHLAHCYRNLGYYFIEQREWKVAAGCYILSLGYEDGNQKALHELLYIEQKAGAGFALPSEKEIKEYAEKYNIPLGADEDIVKIIVDEAKFCKQEGHFDDARNLFNNAYELTGQEEFKEIRDDLPAEKEE